VLCFVAQHGMRGFVREVTVCSTDNLVATLLNRPAVLGPQQVFDLATRLDAQLRAATEPGRGYRPSDHPVGRASRQPSGAPPSTPNAIGVSNGAGARLSNTRRTVRLAVAACAAVFIVLPLLGIIVVSAYTAIAEVGTSVSRCPATAEDRRGANKSGAAVQKDKRPTAMNESTNC
jgi:hypothetical protein